MCGVFKSQDRTNNSEGFLCFLLVCCFFLFFFFGLFVCLFVLKLFTFSSLKLVSSGLCTPEIWICFIKVLATTL